MEPERFVGQAVYRCELENGIDDVDDVVRACRSYRRFDGGDPIGRPLLLTLVNLARRTACAGNRQRLRYHVVTDAKERDVVFGRLSWAADLRDWDGPAEHERPTGYVVICARRPVPPVCSVDVGIVAQTMMMAAAKAGYGGCMVQSFRPDLGEALGLDTASLETELVLAMGKPAERVVLEPVGPDRSTTYWRDADGTHHVPKLSLDDVLV